MDAPVVFQYQQALDQFRRAGETSPLLKRMSELISLLDLTTTLNSGLSREEILEAALLIVMGELQAGRGCLLVRAPDGTYERRASRGMAPGAPARVSVDLAPDAMILRGDGAGAAVLDALGLDVLCPIVRFREAPAGAPPGSEARLLALIGLGARAAGPSYSREEKAFLRSVAGCAATPIENGLIHSELKTVNQRLSLKVYQLDTLFDVSRELTSTFDEEEIKNLVTSTLMAHLMVTRCALFLALPGGGLAVAHERGLHSAGEPSVIPEAAARPVLDAVTRPIAVTELPEGALKDRLERARMALAVPVTAGVRTEGFLAVGERVGGRPFMDEDRDFALTLARQAAGALEAVQLHRSDLEKQRRDKEMQIAREIQQSLFPQSCPAIAGFEVAAESHSCYEVGGDYYDVIPLSQGRWAVAVADVSGKGAPASILMASVHASLRAMAGTAAVDELAVRLNRFLFESTQPNRYVTLFYAELDPLRRRLCYVNAGHVPPFWFGPSGRSERLGAGGPVLGLLEDARYETGEITLAPGELLAMVTDGATEALSPEGEELSDDGVRDLLAAASSEPADSIVRRVAEGVWAWTGEAGCSDDLTLLVLKSV
ncbi:MAG TPA: GAF domain-containing SpoIIE family protein phosphatase [Vicinamibacteria bacterium]|nr:GAF domain-containing SpoIIE family protein phosphatase [Vicinamibacteria bacterium]